jgi:hypothetical protein
MLIAVAVAAGAWNMGTGATAVKRSCTAACDLCCGDSCADCCGDSCALCCGSACCADTQFVSLLDEKKPAAKETKVTGTLVCGKCKLNETKACSNVLVVQEKGKEVKYFLTDKGNDESYHEDVCGGGEKKGVTVTGVVTEKDGKKTIKASKVDLPK